MSHRILFCFTFLFFAFQVSYAQVTWSNSIGNIIYNNCSSCHHAGGIGPFALMSYADAVGSALSIKSATQSKSMPPWKADPTYRHLKNERFLTDAQISDIANWVDNGSPRGDIASEPVAPTFSAAGAMAIIDQTLSLPAYTVQSPFDEYRCFVISAGNTTTKYVNQIEYLPGNDAIVHHIVIYRDPSNYSDSLDGLDTLAGFEGNGTVAVSPDADFLGAWAPGEAMFILPSQFGIKLEPNSDYVVEIHYAPGSMGQTDNSVINIKYSNYSPIREVNVDAILNHFSNIIGGFGSFNIPANTTRTFYERFTLPPVDVSIISVFPHMHKIGTSFKIWDYIPTSGDSIPIINIPNWSFHWQGFYTFQKILKLPASSRLEARATYNNTTSNPDNPSSPPVDVFAGERTTDEMMLAFFAYTPYVAGDENIILDSSILASTVDASIQNPISMSVFPNPAAELLYVTFEALYNGSIDFTIYNTQGAVLYNRKSDTMGERTVSTTIDISQMPAGSYILQLKDEAGNAQQKHFVIK